MLIHCAKRLRVRSRFQHRSSDGSSEIVSSPPCPGFRRAAKESFSRNSFHVNSVFCSWNNSYTNLWWSRRSRRRKKLSIIIKVMFPIRSFLILFSNFSFYRLILLSSLFSVYWPTYILFCFVYLFDSFFLPFSSWKAKEWGNKSIWLKSKRNGISKKSLMRISQRLLVLGGSAAERRKKVSCLALFRLRITPRSAISDHELWNSPRGRCWNSKINFFGGRAPALVTNPLKFAFRSRMATAPKASLFRNCIRSQSER